jgi:Universal stress protein family
MGIDAELVVGKARDGAAHRAIHDLAEQADVDLVVGSRGYGPLAGLMLGSVALRLLQAARPPVLLVPSRRVSGAGPEVHAIRRTDDRRVSAAGSPHPPSMRS